MTSESSGVRNDRRSLTRYLDIVSSIAVVVAAGAVIWSAVGRAPSARSATPALRPPDSPVSISGAMMTGAEQAPVVMIEFSDFQCPFCGRFSNEILPELRPDYIDSGKVQLIFRHLPLPIHDRARPAAEASECAGKQGRFWAMHDLLFTDPKKLTETDFLAYAESAGLDIPQFTKCRASGEMTPRVNADAGLARTLGLTGTPAFLVGRRLPDRKVRVTEVIVGVRPEGEFRKAMDVALEG
jgi:protein-disulfide isomerase